MKKRFISIASILCLAASLLLIPMSALAEQDSWTILIYLCGTDLETEGGEASDNLRELMQVAVPDNINILVETGGTEEWDLPEISDGALQRSQITGGGLKLLETLPKASMGDAKTLESFISYGAANYPADRYMLLLWDHGGGSINGICADELYDFDGLLLSDLASALQGGGLHFDLIGFDACLMATLETAHVLAPHADYMVASEEVEPSGGWDYAAWLRYLCANPGADTAALSRVICDSYYKKCQDSAYASIVTLSAVDLSKVPALVEAFEQMAGQMRSATGDVEAMRAISSAARSAENYGGNNQKEGYTNMVDLGDLATKAEGVLDQTAMQVLDALFDAVVYNIKGAGRINANGLSVYYPLKVEYPEDLETYAHITVSDNYLNFVRTMAGYSTAGTQAGQGGTPSQGGTATPSQSGGQSLWELLSPMFEEEELLDPGDYAVEFISYVDEDADFVLEITEGLEAVESVQFYLSYLDYEYNEYMDLGADNNLYADWDEGIFYDNFQGEWATLDGHYCAPLLLAEAENYNLYTIPILLNGEETNLRAMYIWEEDGSGYYEVLGEWLGMDDDTSMSNRYLNRLSDGDVVELLFDAYSWETEEYTTYIMGEFTVDGAILMQDEPLFDGEYEYYYVIYDIFGDAYFSNSVLLTIDGEDIYIEELDY